MRLALLLILPFLFACQRNQNVGSVDSRDAQESASSGAWPDFIKLISTGVDDSKDFAQGHAVIANELDKTITVHYRFLWYDSNNREISTPGGRWQVVRVMGHEQKQLQSTSLQPGKVHFKLDINVPENYHPKKQPQGRSSK